MDITGTLFIVSAPSGAGKTSLLAAMLKQDETIQLSISHTTRAMRDGEIDGVHYHFVSIEAFTELKNNGGFLESAQVFDNFYGTSEQGVRDQLSAGHDVVLEIDWQGAQQVRQAFPDAISIFVMPPSVEALRERLTSRGQDDGTIVERRMRDAKAEMSHYDEYDYLVVNDDFDIALRDLYAIFRSQQMKLNDQQKRLQLELQGLLA